VIWPVRTWWSVAGGTREPIDAVRVIANRSSGKQGYAIAAEARPRRTGHTRLHGRSAGAPGVTVLAVETAAQMEAALTGLARPPMSS
jgi:phosphopantothenoylcysteine decarboxylase/phosphopantothenate--cysteine ligase